MTKAGRTVADALGVLLQRDFRVSLHAALVDGLHDAVNVSTYPVISGVARLQPVTTAALGSAIGLDRSIVSRRAATLREAGLLTTRTDPSDARASLLTLTPNGQDVVTELRERLVRQLDRRLRSWPPDDRRRFAALLDRFVAAGPL